jgi:hypothetical protein
VGTRVCLIFWLSRYVDFVVNESALPCIRVQSFGPDMFIKVSVH